MQAVEMTKLNSGDMEMKTVKSTLARDFHSVYSSLLDLMAVQESKEEKKQKVQESQEKKNQQVLSSSPPSSSAATSSSTITVAGLKRPPTSPRIGSSKRMKAADSPAPESEPEPKTPDQPTHPRNPDYTGDTVTSKDEDITRQLLIRVVYDSLSLLETDCTRISWQQSGNKVELCETYLLFNIKLMLSEVLRQ